MENSKRMSVGQRIESHVSNLIEPSMCQLHSTPRGQGITWSSTSGATRRSQPHTARPLLCAAVHDAPTWALLRTRGAGSPDKAVRQCQPAQGTGCWGQGGVGGRMLRAGLGGGGGFPECSQQQR